MATPTKTPAKPTTTTAPPSAPAEDPVRTIGTTIEENTPKFISTKIIWTVDKLETFRTETFHSKIIFYPLLLLILFFIGRYIWRKIY